MTQTPTYSHSHYLPLLLLSPHEAEDEPTPEMMRSYPPSVEKQQQQQPAAAAALLEHLLLLLLLLMMMVEALQQLQRPRQRHL